MDEKKIHSLKKLVLILMILASLFHLIQLFIIPINLKWYIALLGAITYGFASLGIYFNKSFGYYLAIIFPTIGGILIAIILLIAAITHVKFLEFNVFTIFAAIVEIPAVLISIYLIKKRLLIFKT